MGDANTGGQPRVIRSRSRSALRVRTSAAILAALTLAAGLSGFISAAPIARAASPPPQPLAGFTQTLLASGLPNPVVLAFAPTGDLWIGCQGGSIRVLHNGVLEPTPVITLNVDSTSELGLLGLAFDPNFAANGYFYVSYTAANKFTRLSRFTAVSGIASASSEKVYVQGSQQQTNFGPGNDVMVGPDGKLWWSVGGNPYPWGNAQTLTNIYGKIIRLNLDGTVPADNPFLDVAGAVPGIYAWGLRNPFRFTFLPDGRMMTADTGSSFWEEMDAIQPGADYGWPVVEGSCGSCGYVNPVYAYGHLPNDGAESAILAYHGAGTSHPLPNSYDHTVFFGDYNRQDIEAVTFDPTYQTETSDTVFDTNAGTISDLIEGPDGSLYYPAIYEGDVWKISASGPFAPTASAAASPNGGLAPISVQFSSAGSADPYGAALSYSWNFGDGSPVVTVANPTHTYTGNGTFTATLTVSNGASIGVATTNVVVGRMPPSANIATPGTGSTYNAGSTVAFSGTATDPVDGTLPASDYTWQVDFYKNGVAQPFYNAEVPHPFLGLMSGETSGSFVIPDDVSQVPGSFYRITLTVVNSAGIPTVVTRDIHPNLTTWTATSSVAGAGFFVDGTWQTGPDPVTDVVGVQHVLTGLGSAQLVGGQRYRFTGWADGSALNDEFTSTSGTATYTADFDPVSSALPSEWTSADVGAPLMPGEADYSTATSSFYSDGGGIDIANIGAAEQFHFTYQALNGDGTIIARVRYQTDSDPYAKAGLMIKQSTTAGSPEVASLVTPDVSPNTPNINGIGCTLTDPGAGCDAPLDPVTPMVGHGIRFQASNGADDAITSPATLAGFTDPNKWLKLQRAGDTFTSWFSTNGSAWQLIGSTTVSMSGPVLIGVFEDGHQNHQLTTAVFDNVRVIPSNGPPPPVCPSGWTCQDIGTPVLAGNASVSGGIWTIQGAGDDIHGTADQFQFDDEALAGNGTISAEVETQGDTNAWAKAGVMLRTSTAPGAIDYALLVSPGNGIVVEGRTTTGGNNNRIGSTVAYGGLPVYLEVQRNGNTFSAYTSTNGTRWKLVPGSTVTITVTGSMLEGLAVTSHDAAALSTVTMGSVIPS
jgi:glucose/arabinose dehydrogenase